jgi:hypothetical protein
MTKQGGMSVQEEPLTLSFFLTFPPLPPIVFLWVGGLLLAE